MTSEVYKFLIIGAGPTGLGAAYRLHEQQIDDWLLVEGSDHFGGLAASFRDDKGFVWDIGGHVQFSHYEYFDRVMERVLGKDGWLHHLRESWVWIFDRFVPYPFQNNLWRLPREAQVDCIIGLLERQARIASKGGSFAEWIAQQFGAGLANVFMEPYNFKVWAHPTNMLSADWVGERVAPVDVKRVIRNVIHQEDDVSWGPNNTFRFPRSGGTGAIWEACGELLPKNNVRLSSKVVKIDLEGKVVVDSHGNNIRYENLISTIPITKLMEIGRIAGFEEAKSGLLHSSSNIFGIGISGQPPDALKTKCWMYFPESNCPFYRVTVFSNYSPNNVPDPKSQWSLMAEVSESEFKPVDQCHLQEEVIEGLLATKLLESRDSILSTWNCRMEYGYPIPSRNRDRSLDQLLPFLEARNVYSRGRFGLWKYEVSNQDHSFMQGVEVVERILNSRIEITAFDPNYANSKKHAWPFDVWN